MKLFYDHLTQLDSLRPDIERYLTVPEEIEEVLAQLDHAMTHDVLRVILLALPQSAHEEFLLRFKEDPSSEHHLVFLRQYEPEIEEHIRQISQRSKQQFLDAIHA